MTQRALRGPVAGAANLSSAAIGMEYLAGAKLAGAATSLTAGGGPVQYGAAGAVLAGATSTTGLVAVPAGVTGNSVVLLYYYIESTAVVTPPAGFTLKATADNTTGGSAHRLYLYWKRATGAESGTYDLSHASAWRAGVALRVDGAATAGDPFDSGTGGVVTGVGGSSTTSPPLAITTTQPGALLVYGVSDFVGTNTYTTPPTGFTEQVDASELGMFTLVQTVAGATGTLFATASAAGVQSAILGAILPAPTLPARDGLLVAVMVPEGRSAANTLLLRFNGDSAANYWTRTFTSAQFIGIATFANNQTVSATSLILDAGGAGTDVAHWFVVVSNRLATTKTAFWQGTQGSGAVGTVPTTVLGTGEWVNTTAQVTSVGLSSTATLPAGTTLIVTGRNYP